MRTDADDLARVRDSAIKLLLSHTATLTDEWCSRPEDPSTTAFAHRRDPTSGEVVPSGSDGSWPLCAGLSRQNGAHHRYRYAPVLVVAPVTEGESRTRSASLTREQMTRASLGTVVFGRTRTWSPSAYHHATTGP